MANIGTYSIAENTPSDSESRTSSCEDSDSEAGQSSAEVLPEEHVYREYHPDINGMLQLCALPDVAYFLIASIRNSL